MNIIMSIKIINESDNSLNYKEIGNEIQKIRKSRDITQEMLAEFTDLSTAHIGHIERGTRIPSLETIVRICRVLQISINTIIPIDTVKSFNNSSNLDSEYSDILKDLDRALNKASDEDAKRYLKSIKVLSTVLL